MRKKSIMIIGTCLILIILLGYLLYFTNYSTLDKNLKHNFPNSEVTIHYRDNENKIILFSEGTKTDRQYVLSKFNIKFDYFYNINDESNVGGVRIQSPFMVTVSNRKSVGNIIWGVFNTQERIAKIDVKFFNKNNSSFMISAEVIDNMFVYYPSELYKTINFFEGSWRYDIKAFDNVGNIILDEKNLNIPGVF